MNASGIILVLIGLFSIVCSVFDFEWFMNHRKARFFVKIFTRNGARIFYAILGLVISTIGILLFFQVIQ